MCSIDKTPPTYWSWYCHRFLQRNPHYTSPIWTVFHWRGRLRSCWVWWGFFFSMIPAQKWRVGISESGKVGVEVVVLFPGFHLEFITQHLNERKSLWWTFIERFASKPFTDICGFPNGLLQHNCVLICYCILLYLSIHSWPSCTVCYTYVKLSSSLIKKCSKPSCDWIINLAPNPITH